MELSSLRGRRVARTEPSSTETVKGTSTTLRGTPDRPLKSLRSCPSSALRATWAKWAAFLRSALVIATVFRVLPGFETDAGRLDSVRPRDLERAEPPLNGLFFCFNEDRW